MPEIEDATQATEIALNYAKRALNTHEMWLEAPSVKLDDDDSRWKVQIDKTKFSGVDSYLVQIDAEGGSVVQFEPIE